MKDQLFYVNKGQEALGKAIRVLESKEGWKVEITEVSWTDMKLSVLNWFIRTKLNESPATVLCWKSFCTSSAVVRATEMPSTAKSCRGAGGSSGWSLSWRLASMSSMIFCFSEWRRCTSGTRAFSKSRWAVHLSHGRRLRTTQMLTLTALGPVFVSTTGSETRRIRNHHHPWGFSPDCRQSDWPEGLCLRKTQLQTQVRCLSQRSSDSAGVLPASGRLCEVHTTRHYIISLYFHGTLWKWIQRLFWQLTSMPLQELRGEGCYLKWELHLISLSLL